MKDLTREELEILEDMINLETKCANFPPAAPATLLEEFDLLVENEGKVFFNSFTFTEEFKTSLKLARDQVIHEQRRRNFKLIKND